MRRRIDRPAEADDWHWKPRAAGHAYKRVYSELEPVHGHDESHRAALTVGDCVNCDGGDIDNADDVELILHACKVFGGRVIQVKDRVVVKGTAGKPDRVEHHARAPLPPSVDPTQMTRWLERARKTGRGGVGEHGR